MFGPGDHEPMHIEKEKYFFEHHLKDIAHLERKREKCPIFKIIKKILLRIFVINQI